MKVGFINRAPDAYPGGDVLSINETIEALGKIGVEAKYIYGDWGPKDLEPFDLLHVKHVNFSWSKWNFKQVWASEKPYVVQPVFYPRTDLGMNAVDIVEALHGAAAVIPYTWAEWLSILSTIDTGISERFETFAINARVQCVPNGTSRAFHHFPPSQLKVDVVAVAARGGKGTEAVEAICRERGWSFQCAQDVPYETMPDFYRSAKVFVSATDGDRMSRTVGEALCSDCRVISSDKNWGNIYYPGLWVYAYEEPDALNALMTEAVESDKWDWSPNEAARLLTWDLVADLLRVIYEEVLRS